ncbi:MAG: DUF1592 domain-containing protein, partial [Planctomycetes bacterium]|nr:DUF1592 domain-containing protein [Planctomycetota bacterium]
VLYARAPYFDPKAAGQGRLLTAGFHLMQGYFRDDQPLCELVLTESERQELDELWRELDFVTLAPLRQYKDFIFFERAEPPRYMVDERFDFARAEDKDAVSPTKMKRLHAEYREKAQSIGASELALSAIDSYFDEMEQTIRRVERDRAAAELTHLAELNNFARRAFRRPLSERELGDLRGFYQHQREDEGLSHEDALRDTLTRILLSPHFSYRFDLAPAGTVEAPLTQWELASRLSFFLWSSLPDAELWAHAERGELSRPDVLVQQARRMMRDHRIRGLAEEFAGNWLDIRRFTEHNAVDRERFSSFTNDLREALYEEPVRFFTDLVQTNRSVTDLLYGSHTFVNLVLARHYGIPATSRSNDDWVRIDHADHYGRGSLLTMGGFLTKNAPGLRTSPVKRGYWVVRRLLGENIPAPPPNVPELPKDEAALGDLTLPQLLARHREHAACAGCHQRFDSFGLAFEGYGPVGERREKDLGGKPVDAAAVYPDGSKGVGVAGLRQYLHSQREHEFCGNLCRKLLSFALNRSLMPSDKNLLDAMQARLAADDYRWDGLVETIVTSRQFLNRRGTDASQENSAP